MVLEGPGLAFTIVSFLVALTVLVFVHEWGHYRVARLLGVRVDVFSIGFGRELFGWTDAAGTRWKISMLPLGGYVRFFGDANAASAGADGTLAHMSAAERAVSFHHKPVWARAAIVAAGPGINFLFAILIYAALFIGYGYSFQPSEITRVLPGSPAEQAGLLPGDRILAVAGHDTESARNLVRAVGLYPGRTVELAIRRDGQELTVPATLEDARSEDRFGNRYSQGRLGVELLGEQEIRNVGPGGALALAAGETLTMVRMMLVATGQVIMGVRSLDDLGGPIRIAKITGEQASLGLIAFIEFVALISINLGLVNLFPIPMLDGGHLMFYAIEAVKGSPLSARMQEFGFMIGMALIVTLMVFLTWNDLNSL